MFIMSNKYDLCKVYKGVSLRDIKIYCSTKDIGYLKGSHPEEITKYLSQAKESKQEYWEALKLLDTKAFNKKRANTHKKAFHVKYDYLINRLNKLPNGKFDEAFIKGIKACLRAKSDLPFYEDFYWNYFLVYNVDSIIDYAYSLSEEEKDMCKTLLISSIQYYRDTGGQNNQHKRPKKEVPTTPSMQPFNESKQENINNVTSGDIKIPLCDNKDLEQKSEKVTANDINKTMDIKGFASGLYSTALEEAKKNATSVGVELARGILDIMSECGEISAYELCQFKKGHAMLTAYSYNEDMASLDLFLFSKASTLTGKIDIETVQNKYSSICDFYREALRNNPFFGTELNEEIKNAISLIKDARAKIQRVRMFFLTNGMVEPSPILNFSEDNEYEHIFMEYSTWDISRTYRMNSINNGNETIEIDFSLNYKTKIQCLRVEDENPKVDAYFAIMPGNVLAKVYEQYKQTLLEGNVRLFLQKTNKVNRQICKTIKERPEMFFSFNNGISATAKHVEFGSGGSKAAPYITKITDLQIVNGGQTTASIASMQECDLSKVFVPMKISVIKDEEEYADIVKEIATSANSQSAIKRSDFLSGDECLQVLEKVSRTETEPVTKTRWYFERKRGQYRSELSSLYGYDKALFSSTYPKNQLLEKSDVAKLALLWDMKPYLACKSKEIVAITYFSDIRANAEVTIDGEYYRNIVSLSLLYNKVNSYVKEKYIKLFGSYCNKISYYVVASIAYMTNGQFDLGFIWRNQKVQTGMGAIVKKLETLVNSHLLDDFKPLYPKEEICWVELKAKLDDLEEVKYKLLAFCKNENTTNSDINQQDDLIEQAFSIAAPVWSAIAEWGKQTGKLSMVERMRAMGYADKRRSLIKLKTTEMAEKAIELEQKARDLGFSMQTY